MEVQIGGEEGESASASASASLMIQPTPAAGNKPTVLDLPCHVMMMDESNTTTTTTTTTSTSRPTTPDSHPSTSNSSSSGESALSTPTQETANPIFLSTTTFDREPLHDSDLSSPLSPSSPSSSPSSSSKPETPPTGPRTPITPTDDHNLDRDSMTSIALSQSSLDYDHLSTEQVHDILSTPRVSGVRQHLRKVSSLDILQNNFNLPPLQSTLFDTHENDLSHQSMSAIEIGQTDKDVDIWRRDSGDMATENADQRRDTSMTLDTIDFLEPALTPATDASMSSSLGNRASDSSGDDMEVDWQKLDKTEEQEKEERELAEGSEDDATAFLLARLEQENAKFAADPKTASNRKMRRSRAYSRPPSMAQLKRLVFTTPDVPSIRYSIASPTTIPEEPPPMTELEFWVALVQDYPSTASRLPTLTTSKIRSGIPPPLRGVVWTSMAGARDRDLEDAYERLLGEKSSYEGIINKDVGRSFPGVELFRDAEGEGQQMLGRVLKCFSLYDKDIGYCQGLGFLVGPLLMNMGERDAFCVLVRLMDHYSLRQSFLPSLSGLHQRIYQFSALLKQHHPKLHDHLAAHGIEPAYLSQWFLSCFAVTCPLAMLFRIYDVIFAEGANETVMRVALALMRRHEERMLATAEFEEIMQLLLGREIWDCYGCDADAMVDDLTSLGDVVTHARLAELQKDFETQSSETVGQSAGFLPDVQAAAARFLGRLWAPGHGYTSSKPVSTHTANASVSTLSPESADKPPARSFFGRPASFLRRSPSKQDLCQDSGSSEDSASTAGSGAASLASTIITEPDNLAAKENGIVRESMADSASMRSKPDSMFPTTPSLLMSQQSDLHAQIEDLLTAIGEMQREQAGLAAMLQKEREERSEDQRIMRQMVSRLRKDKDKEDRRRTMPAPARSKDLEAPAKSRPLSVGDHAEVNLDGSDKQPPKKSEMEKLVEKAEERLQTSVRFSTSLETKALLRSNLARTREQLAIAENQSRDLAARLQASEVAMVAIQDESEDMRSEIKELRARVAEEFKSRQKLEHQLSELKAQARSFERRERLARAESLQETPTMNTTVESNSRKASVASLPAGSAGGLRELRLGRRESAASVPSRRQTSRMSSPMQLDSTPPPTICTDGNVSPCTSTAAFSPDSPVTGDSLGIGHRRDFSRRCSSLVTQEVFATEEHEPIPDEALLMELVNAKTSEAQARQELDEVKKALSVARRTQEETLARMQSQLDVSKAEALRATEVAQAARAEVESARLTGLSGASPFFSMPSTPAIDGSRSPSTAHNGASAVSPAEEKLQPDLHVGKKNDDKGATGGWFWQRRTASKSAIVTPE